MGASVSAAIAGVGTSDGWSNGDRATQLRLLFGGFLDTDCWAVSRKYRSIDDGNGYLTYEELKILLHFEEFNLLFLWDVFNYQNEFIQARELLTTMCLFSSAKLDQKVRFLGAHFDSSRSGRNTGLELAKACTAVLGVMGRCAGSAAKEKDVIPLVRTALQQLSSVFVDACNRVGLEAAFNNERVFGLDELTQAVLPSVRTAYEQVSFSEHRPLPLGCCRPPPPGWASMNVRDAAPVTKPARSRGEGQRKVPEVVTAITTATELAHLAWMKDLDDISMSNKEVLNDKFVHTHSVEQASEFARSWIVMYGSEFKSIAKDIQSFRRLFVKCVSSSLGLPLDCVEVLNVSQGSIIVEFAMRPANRGDAADLVLVLQQQLASPFSALRRSGLGNFISNAELLLGEPRRDAQTAPSAASPKSALEKKLVDAGSQTDALELTTPRVAQLRAVLTALGHEVDAATAAEFEETAVEMRDAVRQLEQARRKATKAEDDCRKVVDQLKERRLMIEKLEKEAAVATA